MRVYKRTFFAEGIDLPFAEFKKTYKNNLKGYSTKEVKEAWKCATNGNIKSTDSKSKKPKPSED